MPKKILLIIAPENYRDEELEHPKEVFIQKGYDVEIASKGVESATGMLGGTTPVDLDISKVNTGDYEAVIFVGGSGSNVYFNDETAHNLAREMLSSDKVVGAICIAPSTLANAGLLDKKKATAFPSEEANLKQQGANYTGELVTVDGKIVTANGPKAAKDFGQKIVELLEGQNFQCVLNV